MFFFFFFFNDTATTEIYTSLHTLSLHDALPIATRPRWATGNGPSAWRPCATARGSRSEEHTSELQSRNDSSYAVCCLKKKKPPLYRCRGPCHTEPKLNWSRAIRI